MIAVSLSLLSVAADFLKSGVKLFMGRMNG